MSEYRAVAEFIVEKIGIPGIVGVSGSALFLPDTWAARIGLLDLRNDHRMWCGLVFAFGLALLLAQVLRSVQARLTNARKNWGIKARVDRMGALLNKLTPTELQVFVAAFHNGGSYDGPHDSVTISGYSRAIQSLCSVGLAEKKHWFPGAYLQIPEREMETMTALYSEEQARTAERRIRAT